MSRCSVRTRRRSRLRRFLLREMKQLRRRRELQPGMTLQFVTTFGDWCSHHERLRRLPR